MIRGKRSVVRDGRRIFFNKPLKRLQLFAGLEADGFSGLDIHLLAGTRIAADAGFARLHVEDAEAAQLDAFTAPEGILQRFENGFDGLLGFAARNICTLHNCVHDIKFYHGGDGSFSKCMLEGGLRVVKRHAV